MKPFGYWNQFENIKKELFLSAERLGDTTKMPSERQLRDMELSSLAIAVTRNGGFPRVAKRVGLVPRRVPNGYYKEFSVVSASLKNAVRRLSIAGFMPTAQQLKDLKLFSLIDAISNDHGGFKSVASKCGLKMTHDKKDNGYYLNKQNLRSEVIDAIRELKCYGRIPSSNELQRINQSGLAAAITKNGGFYATALEFGLQPGRMPNAYWNDQTISRAIVDFVRDYGSPGVFPSGPLLRASERNDLDVAIQRNEGAYKFAKLLDLVVTKGKQQGYWETHENCKREVFGFIASNGTPGAMPTQKEFSDLGRTDINNALWRYEGGHSNFAELYELKINERPKNYWSDQQNLLNELQAFNNVYGHEGQMPSSPQLREEGFGALDAAISSKWGGYFKVAELFGWSSVNQSLWPRSEIEIQIAHELSAVVDVDMEKHSISGSNGKKYDCDIVITSLDLIVEFDSFKWHHGVNRYGDQRFIKDQQKANMLRKSGWQVIRIREKPLEKTHKHDVCVSRPLKKICDTTIERMLQISASGLSQAKVQQYLKSPEVLRGNESREYIERILQKRRGK
ncbi:hypothetical protein N9B10_06470 [Pirellulales bacterium]|nr:hypothetical protein [Pirellulales bacterium]